MPHLSETSQPLRLRSHVINEVSDLEYFKSPDPAVYLFWLPFGRTQGDAQRSAVIFQALARYINQLHKDSTVCIVTTPPDAASLLIHLSDLKLHHWVVVKTTEGAYSSTPGQLPNRHASLLILTRYKGTLRQAKTRIQYTYCPACQKTTKDYGGKKHMYHEYGTAISDVWRDIECNPRSNITAIHDRLGDLFGLELYKSLYLLDLRNCEALAPSSDQSLILIAPEIAPRRRRPNSVRRSQLINGDCLEALRELPDDSVAFSFADLPYNLKKKYCLSKDDLETGKYFAWCDKWLTELYRVLKPGHTLAVLNIPLWSARHYAYLSSMMEFQNWIAWDELSLPTNKMMPAHYTILCFSKGTARPLPGLRREEMALEDVYLKARREHFCSRKQCVSQRGQLGVDDRIALHNIWHDIHRLKHNSQRVNHPCQLPPLLMRRLIALFTHAGEMVLDCFNASGTTSLVARELARRYIGIEKSKRYHNLAQKRHDMLERGEDPFGKNDSVPKSKNSTVQRLRKQAYPVSKKTLQLEVKQIAEELGRMPTLEDVAARSPHPVEYFRDYFIHWGEVCAAARTTGMSEVPLIQEPPPKLEEVTP